MTDSTRFQLVDGALDRLPPDQRRMAIRALADMAGNVQRNALWRFDPLDPKGDGVPHIPQHQWMSAWKTPEGRMTKFRLFAGGNRAGKTTAGDVGLIIDCCDDEAIPPHLQRYKRWHKPIQCYLVAVSGRAVERIHLPVFREWCPKDQLVGGSFEKAFNKEYQTLHFKNGSSIAFMTQGMDVEVFQGTSLHVVQFDEEPLYDHGREIFGECIQRLVDHNGDMRFTFTPLNGLTWVYDVLWKPWQEQQPDQEAATSGFSYIDWNGYDIPVYCHRVDQDDNPAIDDEGKAGAMAMAASDEERQARKSGLFVSMAGRAFEHFSRSLHVVPDDMVLEKMRAYDPEDPRASFQLLLGGLDPGFRHMAAALWVGMDDEGIWVGPEVTKAKTVIAEVAGAIIDASAALEVPLPLFMADPAIEKTDAQTGLTDRVAFHNAGIMTRIANNSRRPSINAIKSICYGRNKDGSPRLHVAASCEVLIDQLQRARWKSTGRSENDAPEDIVKADDHAIDAFRYALMAMPIPEVQLQIEAAKPKQQRWMEEDLKRARQGTQDGLPYGEAYWQ